MIGLEMLKVVVKYYPVVGVSEITPGTGWS